MIRRGKKNDHYPINWELNFDTKEGAKTSIIDGGNIVIWLKVPQIGKALLA